MPGDFRATKYRVGARRPLLTMKDALGFVHEWLEWDRVWTPEPTDRHAEIFAGLLTAVPRNRLD